MTIGHAKISDALPGWVVAFDGMTRSWIVRSPGFALDGLSVSGETPEDVIDRTRALLRYWNP